MPNDLLFWLFVQALVEHGLPLLEELAVAKDIALMNVGVWHAPTEMPMYRTHLQAVCE